ncbi:MAG TPA: hypothetical protein VMD28_10365 [Acidimicrobiales bacterium]|nr:hypothetical protein [Acidimicrobiales bacterium]
MTSVGHGSDVTPVPLRSSGSDGYILTLVVSLRTHRGVRLSTPVDDAGVLRTIEAL